MTGLAIKGHYVLWPPQPIDRGKIPVGADGFDLHQAGILIERHRVCPVHGDWAFPPDALASADRFTAEHRQCSTPRRKRHPKIRSWRIC